MAADVRGQSFGLPFLGGPAGGSAMPGAAWLEQLSEAQKKWGETITDMLNKHRESLDAQYKAGIRTIEEAFKVGEAKDPQQFRRLTEDSGSTALNASKPWPSRRRAMFRPPCRSFTRLHPRARRG